MSVFAAVFTGLIAYYPAAQLNSLFLKITEININSANLTGVQAFIYSLFVGINEEFLKFIITFFIIMNAAGIKTKKQVLTISAAAGLGFAVLENIFYMQTGSPFVLMLRIMTASPLHIGLALIWGCGINAAVFQEKNWGMKVLIFLSISSVLHAIYNYAAIISISVTESISKTAAVLLITATAAFLSIRFSNNKKRE